MKSTGSSVNLSWWVLIIAVLFLPRFSFGEVFNGRNSRNCKPSSCGNIHNISYPFRLTDDPNHCGQLDTTLSCENNTTLYCRNYIVQAIHYHNQTIRLLDPNLLDNFNYSTIPRNILHPSSSILGFPFEILIYGPGGEYLYTPIFFWKCLKEVNSSSYVNTSPFINVTDDSRLAYGYFTIGLWELRGWKEGCSPEWMALTFLNISKGGNVSYKYLHDALAFGFQLQYSNFDKMETHYSYSCSDRQWSSLDGVCFRRNIPGLVGLILQAIKELFYDGNHVVCFNSRWIPIGCIEIGWLPVVGIGLFFLARLIFGTPLVISFLIYKWRKRHLSIYANIEDFLHRDENFGPIRYSYSDIKKMTNKFEHKLGQGGYGSVFKGKLRSGHFGAIKVLGNSKTNGQDFMNEVATIGRIHHKNIVQLVGYCVEGTKRALVYDFMPNGSLDKYIYCKEGSIPLQVRQIYEIALGVSQGIEYLHQGCEMQILHFDIKPHNILLDENLIPKVSDFGLAKLYPTDDSIVSLTAARGTLGYIAPELFYKNIGGVSYKADVYSFGMLLMEMASKRKNLNAMVEHSSQEYFPSWVYDQYSKGNDNLEIVDVTEEERKIIKKMIMTSLWCIQMKPNDRPSMKKVIEMLEGDVEDLRMPMKPFLYHQHLAMPVREVQDNNLNPPYSTAVELTSTLTGR